MVSILEYQDSSVTSGNLQRTWASRPLPQMAAKRSDPPLLGLCSLCGQSNIDNNQSLHILQHLLHKINPDNYKNMYFTTVYSKLSSCCVEVLMWPMNGSFSLQRIKTAEGREDNLMIILTLLQLWKTKKDHSKMLIYILLWVTFVFPFIVKWQKFKLILFRSFLEVSFMPRCWFDKEVCSPTWAVVRQR